MVVRLRPTFLRTGAMTEVPEAEMPIDQTFYFPLSDNCGVLETFIERRRHKGNPVRRNVRLLVWRPVLEDNFSRLTWESMKTWDDMKELQRRDA